MAATPICRKRLIGEIRLLKKDPHKYIDVAPDENDILTWYFLIKGPEFSDFAGGYYIGKIMHNPEYPLKPPDFMMLTPSGRFMINQKICLSNTGYHSEEWSAMWNIHAILTGLLSIMLDDKEHGIAHIFNSQDERKVYAMTSMEYNKKNHLDILKRFTRFIDQDGDPIKSEENMNQPTDNSNKDDSNKEIQDKNNHNEDNLDNKEEKIVKIKKQPAKKKEIIETEEKPKKINKKKIDEEEKKPKAKVQKPTNKNKPKN